MQTFEALFTLEEAFDAEVGDGEAQHGQLVQFGDDVRRERQQAGQAVQFGVEPVPVPLGRVAFLVGRGRLPADDKADGNKRRDVNVWDQAGAKDRNFWSKLRLEKTADKNDAFGELHLKLFFFNSKVSI